MKSLFYDIEQFMYRRPTDDNKKMNFSEDEINQVCGDSVFREKVSIASQSLLDMMNIYMKKPDQLSGKKLIGLHISIMKYLIRSRTRTTPFGLFSGVGIGKFSESEKFPKLETKYAKKVNIDSEWLFGVISYIEKLYAENLEFRLNDACYIKGNRVILIYSTEKDAEEISIRFTKVFQVLCDYVKDYKDYKKIVDIIHYEYPDTSVEKIKSYIDELISKGFLISKLRPSFNNPNPLIYLIEQCNVAALPNISKKIIEIKNLCQEYIQTDIGEGSSKYYEIIDRMKELYKCSSYLQIDTVIENGNFQLKQDISGKIGELASFFVYISNNIKSQNGYLEHYKSKFIEKYGMEREIPLLEMIDSSNGIGAPSPYLKPKNDFYDEYNIKDNYNYDLKNYFMTEYEKALKNNSDINIDMDIIQKITDCTVEDEEIPISLELYFILKQKDGKINLYLSPNCGSFGAGKTFGRFSVLSSEFAKLLKKCNFEERKIRDKNVEMCEISFLPSPIRNGNVVRTLSFREKEMAVFTNGNKDIKDRISLNDIYIGVFNGKFYARNKKNDKQITFEANNMYNPMLSPNVFRFIQDISCDGKRAWSEFPWNYIYASLRHVPAIKFKDIVIQNERWKINSQEVGLNDNGFIGFKERFVKLVIKYNIPSDIYIVDTDNRIKLDLTKELSMRIIYDELKKHKDRDLIFEKVEDGEDIIYDDGLSYMTEIVVPIFRKNKEEISIIPPSRISVFREEHIILPFDNWLYLKLYCNQNREEELIAFYIMDFCEELKKKYGIEYFYMRYADPKPHIRLRLHASKSLLLQVYPQIMNWNSELFSDQVIGDISISVYEREVERYGGLTLMEVAEKLFFEDSYIVESILRLKRLGKLTLTLEEIAIISIIMYVSRFYKEFDQQLNFLLVNYHSSDFMSEFKKKKENLLKVCNFEKGWDNLIEREDGKIIYELLIRRNQLIDLYREGIEKTNSDQLFKNDIVASVIHLHCNRLIGTNRELERKLMAFAESILYAKRYMMKRIEKNEKE